MHSFSKISKHLILFLIIIGLIVYTNSLFNNFVLDDFDLVVNNLPVHSISHIGSFFTGSIWNSGGTGGLAGQYYRPLSMTILALIYTLFGGITFPFHLSQTLIHIANSILLFVIFRKFINKTLAWFLAAIFLIHPLNVEAVGYIASFGDVLYAFFGLLAVWMALKKELTPRRTFFTYVLLLFSILSKESGVIFLLAVLFIFFYQKKQVALNIVATFLFVCFYAVLRLGLGHVSTLSYNGYPMMKLNLWQRMINIPMILWYYLKTFLFPKDLITAQNWNVTSPAFTSFYLPLLLMIVLAISIISLVIHVYKHHNKSLMPLILFLLLFSTGLGVVLQIAPLTSTVSDRWFYVPMIGLLGCIGITLQILPEQWQRIKPYSMGLTILIILLLSTRTIIRNNDWRNEYVLVKHDLALSPHNYLLENVYGYELMNRNQLDLAKQHLQKSIKIAPYYWVNWNNLGAVENRIGISTHNNQAIKNAELDFQKSIDNGQYYLAYENLASTLYFFEPPQRARDFTQKALRILPYNSRIWLILGLSEYKLGNKQQALSAITNSYTIKPNNLTANIYQVMQNNGIINLKPGT